MLYPFHPTRSLKTVNTITVTNIDILIKVQRGSDAGPRHEYECVLDFHYLSNEMLVAQ